MVIDHFLSFMIGIPMVNHRLSVLSWATWVFYIFFLKGCEAHFICSSWLLDSRLCLEFISTILAAGLFLRASVIESPTGLMNWRYWEAMTNM